jgi:type IV pilus assembly protein PilM
VPERGPAFGPTAQVPPIVDAVCDTIAGEIQRSLDFFLATSGEPEMHRIYLTGGTSNLPALPAAISRRSRVQVEMLQPLERVAVEGKDVNADMLRTRGSQLCVALGLAMRKDKEKRA